MKIVSALRSIFRPPRSWWFDYAVVSGGKGFVVTGSRGPNGPTILAASWNDVRAVCFIDGGLSSDCFYTLTRSSSDPIMIPAEAEGGISFWEALKQRDLFPPEVSDIAVRSTVPGAQLWWPREAGSQLGG